MKTAPWLEIAIRELVRGVDEIPGQRHNPRILEYHSATTLGASDDETPWCAAFMNWCLRECWIKGTNSAAARSFVTWGQESEPVPGAIVTLWRGSPDSTQGHVGTLVDRAPGRIYLCGGNQRDRVSVAAYPVDRVLAYRKPL